MWQNLEEVCQKLRLGVGMCGEANLEKPLNTQHENQYHTIITRGEN